MRCGACGVVHVVQVMVSSAADGLWMRVVRGM